MTDVRIYHDHVFRLCFEGEVVGPRSAAVVDAALAGLPAGADAVIDLTRIADLDGHNAEALRLVLAARKADDVVAVVAAADLAVRATLMMAEVDFVVPVVESFEDARTVLWLQAAA